MSKRFGQSFWSLVTARCGCPHPTPSERKAAFLSPFGNRQDSSRPAPRWPQCPPPRHPGRGSGGRAAPPSPQPAAATRPSPAPLGWRSYRQRNHLLGGLLPSWGKKYNLKNTHSSLGFRGKCLTPVLIDHGNRGNTGTLKYPIARL